MSFNCPKCGFNLPGTPERTEDCYFCGWTPPNRQHENDSMGVASVTPVESLKDPYGRARQLLAQMKPKTSWRKLAIELGAEKDRIDSVAAQLCNVAKGGERPVVLTLLGITPKMVEIKLEEYERLTKKKARRLGLPPMRVRIAADVSIEQREALHSKAAAIGVSFSELLRAVADDEIELVVLPGFRHYGRLIEGVDYIDSDFATED